MRFEYPSLLWLLGIVGPGLSVFCWWAWRRRRELIALFVQSRLLSQLTVGVSARRQKWRMALVTIAVVLLVIVLARPQWGFDFEEAKQRGLDIVVGLDTSRSMLAADVAPNRLERAKLAALDLLRAARTDRLGLVAFSGSAFLQCPLTVDDAAFRQSLQALDTSIIPQGGTALAEAIRAAETAFGEKNDNYKVLVLFTDGEDHDGKVMDAARDAAENGLRIFTVGVGTPSGELLAIPDGKGGTEFLKDERGNVVKSRLDESVLQQIAESTGGFYLLLTGANPIDLLYERGLAPLPKAEFAARRVKRYHERFQWFLAAAVMLLIIEAFLPDRRRPSQTESVRPTSGVESLRSALVVALCLAFPLTSQASAGRAMKALRAGNYAEAQAQFEQLLEKGPHDSRLHYNAGSAAYNAGDFASASSHFRASLLTDDLALQEQSYYNLGNAQFRLGEKSAEPNEKQSAWHQALQHFESALKLDPQDADAQFNLDFVKKQLEELQKQQQESNESSNNQEESKQDQNQQEDASPQNQPSQENQKQDQSQPQESPPQQQPQPPDTPQSDPAQQSESQTPSDKKEPQEKDAEQSKPGQSSEKQESDQATPEKPGEGRPAQAPPMVMTPEQARRLLESVQGEERTLIFVPPQMTNRNRRVTRDW